MSDFESRIELQALEQDELIAEQLNFDLKIKGLEHELRRDADLCSSRVNEKQARKSGGEGRKFVDFFFFFSFFFFLSLLRITVFLWRCGVEVLNRQFPSRDNFLPAFI